MISQIQTDIEVKSFSGRFNETAFNFNTVLIGVITDFKHLVRQLRPMCG